MPNFTIEVQSLLLELEKTQNEFWNIDPASANFLYMQILALNSKNALELGTSNGYSAIWLASALKQTGGKLTTIEFWDKRQNIAIENFKTCGFKDIIETKLGSACEILREIKEEFDFVFIDANKLEYLKYFELIHPLLKPGGVMFSDNITSHAKKVEPFMEVILAHPQYENELLPFPAGLLMSYKKY